MDVLNVDGYNLTIYLNYTTSIDISSDKFELPSIQMSCTLDRIQLDCVILKSIKLVLLILIGSKQLPDPYTLACL